MSHKVLILSSYGGGAHESARREIERIFQEKNWESRTVYPIDQMKVLGVSSPEKNIYNPLLKRDLTVLIEFSRLTFRAIYTRQKCAIKRIIDRHIQIEKPNLIVSLIPIINTPAIELASEKEIPYILVTVDRDLRNYFLPREINSQCYIFTANERGLFGISRGFKTIETGFAIRKQFTTPILESNEKIREDLELPPRKNIVLLMMGGEGTNKLFKFAKQIIKSNLNIHLVIFCGRNEKIKAEIDTIEPSEKTTVKTLGFTQDIARYMKVASLLVTKPGPMTIEEAITMKCFVILDNTNTLSWEKENIRYVLGRKIGYSLDAVKSLPSLIENHLNVSPSYPEDLPPNSFDKEFGLVVDQIYRAPKGSL